jgi:hypothetical protein
MSAKSNGKKILKEQVIYIVSKYVCTNHLPIPKEKNMINSRVGRLAEI